MENIFCVTLVDTEHVWLADTTAHIIKVARSLVRPLTVDIYQVP